MLYPKLSSFYRIAASILVATSALYLSQSDTLAQDRTSVSYNSNGGVRQGQQAADDGWKFFGFDVGGLFKDRAPFQMDKGPQFPGFADPGKKEIVPPTVTDTRTKPEPVQNIKLPTDPRLGKVETMQVEFYSPGYGTFLSPCKVQRIADPQGLNRELFKNVNNGQIYQGVNGTNGYVLRPL